MPVHDGPQDVDYQRALRLLLFTNPSPGVDAAGVNGIFAEVGESGRAGQVMLALADLAHMHAPVLGSVEGVESIRRTLAQYEIRLMEQQQEDGDHGGK